MSRTPSAFRLQLAARWLASGEILAYPTEAVYGLGCNPLDGPAVRRLLELKQRPLDKGLILIAADFAQLAPFLASTNSGELEHVFSTWPGPYTWLLPANTATPRWLTGRHDTLAVRVTAHPIAAALCTAFGGAIVSTSANLAGRPPARNALQVRRRCPGIDRILSGPCGGLRSPTAIRDARTHSVIRAG